VRGAIKSIKRSRSHKNLESRERDAMRTSVSENVEYTIVKNPPFIGKIKRILKKKNLSYPSQYINLHSCGFLSGSTCTFVLNEECCGCKLLKEICTAADNCSNPNSKVCNIFDVDSRDRQTLLNYILVDHNREWVPRHIVLKILDSFPEACQIRDCLNFYLLHIAARRNCHFSILKKIYECFPEAAVDAGGSNRLPVEEALANHSLGINNINFLLSAHPSERAWNALKRFQCMKTRPGAKREQWYKILFCSFVKCFVESRYMMRNNENQSEALFSPLHAVLQDELVDVLGTEYIFFHFLSEYRSDASRVDSDGRW